jgi:hypothetical protein
MFAGAVGKEDAVSVQKREANNRTIPTSRMKTGFCAFKKIVPFKWLQVDGPPTTSADLYTLRFSDRQFDSLPGN